MAIPMQYEGCCDHANLYPCRVQLKNKRTGHALMLYDAKVKAFAFQVFIAGLYPVILPRNFMNTINKTALTLFITVFLGASSITAFAKEAAKGSEASINETISHVEKALVEIKKSDFASANLHLKAARASSAQITGDDTIVKQANANVIQGQIQSNQGEVEKSAALLTKGLDLYKSL